MNADEYIEKRLDDQIAWLDRKSAFNQKYYMRLSLAQVAAAISIPVLAGLAESNAWARWTIGILGALIALTGGVLSLQRYQAKWIEYRSTCEALKRERFTYVTGVDPYHGPDAFQQLVKRVESTLANENSNWAQSMRAPPPAAKPSV